MTNCSSSSDDGKKTISQKKNIVDLKMSGNESKTGWSTVLATAILNEFADLGIYNILTFFLDFHNGTPNYIYLKYFLEDLKIEYIHLTDIPQQNSYFGVLELDLSSPESRKENRIQNEKHKTLCTLH